MRSTGSDLMVCSRSKGLRRVAEWFAGFSVTEAKPAKPSNAFFGALGSRKTSLFTASGIREQGMHSSSFRSVY